jgi:hypothetical protein
MVNVRRTTALCLAIVGALVSVMGIILVVADRSIFDEGRIERITEEIVADRDVKRLLAREITNRLVELGDLASQRDIVSAAVDNSLSDERVQGEVVSSAMAAYEALVGSDSATIDFNLRRLSREARAAAVRVNPVLDQTLPPAEELLRFQLFAREDVPWQYDVIDGARKVAWWILVGGLMLIAAALVLGPGRFSLVAVAAAFGVAGMFLAAALISAATDSAIDGIDDQLSRRVARLATDGYLETMNHVALAVVIFGLITVVAGVGGSWIKNSLWPPNPHAVRAHA